MEKKEVKSPPEHSFLDHLIKVLNLKNDAALSRALDVEPSVISKIRHRRYPFTANLQIKVHEMTGMRTQDIRKMLAEA